MPRPLMDHPSSEYITIRATRELFRQVRDLAKFEHRALSFMGRILLEEALEARRLLKIKDRYESRRLTEERRQQRVAAKELRKRSRFHA